MKIQSSNIQMAASSSKRTVDSSSSQLSVWGLSKSETTAVKEIESDEGFTFEEDYQLSDGLSASRSQKASSPSAFQLSDEDSARIDLLTRMIEALTGKKMRFLLPIEILSGKKTGTAYDDFALSDAQQGAGWGIDYQSYERREETASVSFNASGVINTADGRSIKVDVSLNMSHSFVSENYFSFKAGDALKDPLVINLDSAGTSLTNTKYSFDLDSDGKSDSISFVSPGSGFLALDKNADGIINNGSELFGPNSGDGFSELAAYDSDRNGWIDENDPIYDKLRIWTKDESGNDQLFALGQKGVGAIYLGNIQTSFDIKDTANEQQGKVQKTGLYLREDGTAGTMQHVDLAY